MEKKMPINHSKIREIQMRQYWHQPKEKIQPTLTLKQAEYVMELFDLHTEVFDHWKEGVPYPSELIKAFKKIRKELRDAKFHNDSLH
tara:strand:+ start:666 stop:926 length:261 start_codon:yes stop_codon:yes gene_type:complete